MIFAQDQSAPVKWHAGSRRPTHEGLLPASLHIRRIEDSSPSVRGTAGGY